MLDWRAVVAVVALDFRVAVSSSKLLVRYLLLRRAAGAVSDVAEAGASVRGGDARPNPVVRRGKRARETASSSFGEESRVRRRTAVATQQRRSGLQRGVSA